MDWSPFESEVQFKLADFLYHWVELSVSNVEILLDLWAESMSEFGASAPLDTFEEMHILIDSSTLGDAPWQCMVTTPSEGVGRDVLRWMWTSYKVWYCNPEIVVSQMLANPDFDGQFDLCPYIDLDEHGK